MPNQFPPPPWLVRTQLLTFVGWVIACALFGEEGFIAGSVPFCLSIGIQQLVMLIKHGHNESETNLHSYNLPA